jgi:hypothetical protein
VPEEIDYGPVKITPETNASGGYDQGFNQPLDTPGLSEGEDAAGRRRLYIQNYEEDPYTGKRMLVGLAELDVSRDVMDFSFITDADPEAAPIEFYLDLSEWSPTNLGVSINFTNPLLVGKGSDNIMTGLKDPELFAPANGGDPISADDAVAVKEAPA